MAKYLVVNRADFESVSDVDTFEQAEIVAKNYLEENLRDIEENLRDSYKMSEIDIYELKSVATGTLTVEMSVNHYVEEEDAEDKDVDTVEPCEWFGPKPS